MCSCSGLNYVLPQPLYLWIWPSLFVNKVFGDVIKLTWGHRRLGFPDSSVGKQFSCNARNPSSIPGLGRPSGEGIGYPLQYSWASLVAQLVAEQRRRPGFDPWVGKIPWRRERLPTPVFWPEEFHGLYGPWGRKESDMTERLSLHFDRR